MNNSDTKINTIVPKLRFPEFIGSQGWVALRFGQLYSFKVTNSFSREKLNYDFGFVKNIHYGDIHKKFSTLFDINHEVVPFINPAESIEKIKDDNYCIEGDIIFADASEDLDGIGKNIELVELNNEKLLSGLHTLLARQKYKKIVIGFGGYLFNSDKISNQIKKEAQGAKVFGISSRRLSNIEINYPVDQKEQQKIVDCLSSVDDLILAQERKIDSLQKHKKGLMQQLFPNAGAVVPNLRFSEFLNGHDWYERKLNNICNFVRGPFGGSLKKDIFVKDGYAVYEQSHAIYQDFNSFRYYISEEKFNELKRFAVRPNEIIMSCSGTMGKFAIIPENAKVGVINQALLKLSVKNNYNLLFIKMSLEHPINQKKLLSKSAGGVIKNVVSVELIKELDLLVPDSKEQQKIADCLSSLDELISLEIKKLELFKIHKKGLMQQLFPSMDEVS